MPFTLRYFNVSVFQTVDNPVGIVYVARPPAGQIPSQRFGFSDSCVAIALDVGNQLVYLFQRSSILPLPIEVILPCSVRPKFFHELIFYQFVFRQFPRIGFTD